LKKEHTYRGRATLAWNVYEIMSLQTPHSVYLGDNEKSYDKRREQRAASSVCQLAIDLQRDLVKNLIISALALKYRMMQEAIAKSRPSAIFASLLQQSLLTTHFWSEDTINKVIIKMLNNAIHVYIIPTALII